jgi:glycine/D-amino acid oxidase-like deaminating enzyme
VAQKAAEISHWFAQMYGEEAEVPARAPLSGSREADVCIVGAGYTGLWTAYALKRAEPSLDVVVLEAKTAGFGASGRNGGAVIAQLAGSREHWVERGGRDGALAIEHALQATVDEIGATVEREGIDCSFSKNGVLMVARNELELRRFQASVEADRRWGFGPEDSTVLDAAEVAERIAIDGALGARFSRHCASMHPGRLVRGLADAVERLGATIHDHSPVTRVEPHAAHTTHGVLRARFVVRATEAFTESVGGARGLIVPIHTSMLVTEPIPAALWEQVGWARREALLAEHPFLHLQHTADGRITIGGDDNRVPYKFGSNPGQPGPAIERVRAMYHAELVKLFPALRDVKIERTWTGVFGTSRRWVPTVGVDRATGLAWAGGYVGEGVAPSNLAGRTLADLLLGRDSELTRLPWVDSRPLPRWHPEPLRAIGSTLVWAMRDVGDRQELRSGKPSKILALGNKLAGYGGHLG